MSLYYSGIVCELREVVLKNKPKAMLDASPKGTVPVLVLQSASDCRVIDESIDVMNWALSQSDPKYWLDQPLDHELIRRNDGSFKQYLDRYKYFERYPEQTQDVYFVRACEFLKHMEGLLCANDAGEFFLGSTKISVLDIAIFPFIRQFALVDKLAFDQLPYPRLQAWLEYFLKSPLFLDVMSKFPAWLPEQPEKVWFGRLSA